MNLETIFRHAHRDPEKIALVEHGVSTSYGEFAYWIGQARDFLAGQELETGTVAVLLSINRRLELWAFALALRSLGLTTLSYYVFDSAPPDVYASLRVRDISCIITTLSADPRPFGSADRGFKLIRIPEGLFAGKQHGPVPQIPTTAVPDGGHIRLTSGTTGASKKVLLTPAVISAESRRRAGFWSITPESVVNTFHFAIWSGLGFFVPSAAWAVGASVVFAELPETQRASLAGCTHAFTIPGHLLDLLRAPPGDGTVNDGMRLFVGAGSLPIAVYRAAREALTHRIYCVISSTEVGPWALTPIEREEDLGAHLIHPTMEVQVVDEASRPLPAGRTGAVRIRTNGITEYVEDNGASAAFFRDGFFYPGDLGMFRGDGRFVMCGRVTNVINIFGEKIPAEMLEQALQDRLGLDGVCVFSAPGDNGEEALHVVVESRAQPAEDRVTEAVWTILNRSPRVQVRFATIPRNDMGKTDRAAVILLTHDALRVATG